MHDSTQSFHGLVDDYLSAFPPTGEALDEHTTRFTTAHVLILQAKQASGQTHPLDAASCRKLVACLFVLLVQENLVGGHERVLGMGVDEVYEMLTDLIAAHRITLEELEAAVASVDRDGAAVWLSQQPQQIEALWRRRDATSTRMLRAMHDAVAASGDTFRTFGTSMLPLGFVPEWYTEDLVGHAEFRSLVGERLSKRSALLIGFALLSFVLYFIAFRVLDSFSLSMECVWVSLYLLPICTEALVACALYPSDLTTQSAQRYMLVILWLKNLLTWLTIYDEWPRQSPSKSPSYQFNRVGMILSSVTNLTGILLTVTGRYTWRLRRALELLESVQTTACIAIQAHLGHAADGYYPGLQRCCASLYGALLCCLLPLVMNTLAMRPESRRRISAWSIRLGLNHVCIKLRDVPPAQLRLESSGGTSCGFSSCPCSSTHKGGGSDVQWGTLGQARAPHATWRAVHTSQMAQINQLATDQRGAGITLQSNRTPPHHSDQTALLTRRGQPHGRLSRSPARTHELVRSHENRS